MLNMQVVSTSIRIGRQKGYVFSLGMAAVIGLQAALAVLFADLLTGDLQVVPLIKQYAVQILVVLAAGFVVKGFTARAARKAHVEKHYTGDPFLRGVMMSAMNVLNIPFIFAIAGFLVANNYLPATHTARILYVPGVACGALAIFCSYARLADWIRRNAAFFTRNIYFFVGGLLAVGAVVEAVRIY